LNVRVFPGAGTPSEAAVNVVDSPKNAASTVAAAPLAPEWPDGNSRCST
jgi:hypothetical protein